MTSEPSNDANIPYNTAVTLTCALTTDPANNELALKYSFKPPASDYGAAQDSDQHEITMKQDQDGDHQCKVSTADAGVVFSSAESNALRLTLETGFLSFMQQVSSKLTKNHL